MQKTLTISTQRVVTLCDLCEKQVDHLRTCQICQREVAFCCGTTQFLHDDSPGLIDIGLYVCKDCLTLKGPNEIVGGHPFWLAMMRHLVRDADEALMAFLKEWRQKAKERKAAKDARQN